MWLTIALRQMSGFPDLNALIILTCSSQQFLRDPIAPRGRRGECRSARIRADRGSSWSCPATCGSLEQGRVSGPVRDQPVQADVELVERFKVVSDRLISPGLASFQMCKIRRGELATRKLDCHPLERLADLMEVD